MSATRKSLVVIGLAVAAILLQGGWASAAIWPGSVSTNFESYTAGSSLNSQDGWVNDSPYITVLGTGGVSNSKCVSSGQYSGAWTSKSFNWGSDVTLGQKYIARMDFQTSTSGTAYFDDDRVGWTIVTGNDSSKHFGVQLDNSDSGGSAIVCYWKALNNSTSVRTKIASWPTGMTNNTWYRFELDVTRQATSAEPRIDLSLVQLDASGNPTGTVTTGTLDTSTMGTNRPYTGYFTSTAYPMFKNYNANNSGYADNAYFAVTPEPATLALLAAGGVVALLRRRR